MGVRLPPEYQEVEHIAGSGNQYINTGINLGDSGYRSETVISWNVIINRRQLTGAQDVGFWGVNANGYYEIYQASQYRAEVGRWDNVSFEVTYSGGKSRRYLTVNGAILFNGQESTTSPNGTIYVFDIRHPTVTNTGLNAKIKSHRIFVSDELVRDFVPCYRKSDDKPGMYDLVSDTFFTNAGTGEFAVGPDVIDSISPWLVARRRMLMQDKIYCPYITDGLIFWLDGICKGTDPTIWKDLIGRKNFALNNCSFTTNGVRFASGSYGEFDGAISNDWGNETIEIAVNTSTTQNCFVLPPYDENGTGIGAIQGNTTNFGFRIDGGDYRKYDWSHGWKTASVNNSYGVRNLTSVRRVTVTDHWGANNTGKTYIGRRVPSNSYQFAGIMHCIRIYNRHLSIAEMQANQQIDNIRFNLGL